jgi:hypothetical protein
MAVDTQNVAPHHQDVARGLVGFMVAVSISPAGNPV